MLCIIWIGVGPKTTFEDDRWCVSIYFAAFSPGLRIWTSELGAHVTDKWVQSRVNIFDIILAHNFFVNDGRILLLLRKG